MKRDTTSGLKFEEKIKINKEGINVSKHALYRYLKSKNINYLDYISKKLLPDEAYINEIDSTLYIYEKKFQKVEGSVDEKLQTAPFKILQYTKLANALNLKNVEFTYILSNFFKSPKYKDTFDYLDTFKNCHYYFEDEVNAIK